MADKNQAADIGQSESAQSLAAEDVHGDSLLGCLEFVARHFDRSIPPSALVSGLPLQDGLLTPRLFPRAAARAGLSARIVRRPLDKLSSLFLPAILLLESNEAIVLVELGDNDQAKVVVPETGRGVAEVKTSELAERYSGYVILLKPEYQFQQNEADADDLEGQDWFWSAVKPLWPNYLQILIAAALINVLALASPLFIMNVYDRVLPNKAIPTLWVLAIGIGLAILFDFILKMLRNALIGNAGRRADILLASRLFGHVLNLDLSQRPMKTGEFANQLRDFETVREFFTSNTVVTLTDFVFIWLFIFIIYQIAGIVALAPAVAVVLVLVAGVLLQIPLRKTVDQAQSEATHRHSILIEALTGLETIKTSRAESQFQTKWEQFVGQNAKTAESMRLISAIGMNFTAFAQQLVTVGVVIIGVYLFNEGDVSPGAIIAAVILAGRAVGPLGQIAGTIGRSQQAFHSLKVLNQIMSVPGEDSAHGRHINRSMTTGSVEFDNVTFNYPGSEQAALKEFSLKIEPGERVGVIGRIGSGKTTLGRLISRLYVPSDGSLLLDGVDIRQYHPSDVRRRVAFVSQDSAMFHGSVRDNIVLGAPYVSDDLVLRAADLAGVSDFVKPHPQGFNMPVGETGRFLSSGQRQAIALARAFLFDPLIVFLDEPSGSMDMASERALIERLKGAFRPDQTVILTTHRTAVLSLVSRLVVLENGVLVADGPRDKVLKMLKEKATARDNSPATQQVGRIVTPKSGDALHPVNVSNPVSGQADNQDKPGGQRGAKGKSSKKAGAAE
ncbi:MAG: type I secretion system permease/ATPase [Hyphomicrobiaceae bacterium]|nr:type I secretion system permease/ATPase [Hyphomicrobiaceae bacterium]